MRVEDFLDRLESFSTAGDGWAALCPAHDDSNPSLSIGIRPDGAILVNCHAGCDTADVVEALGLEMKHLFPGNDPPITVDELAADKGLPADYLKQAFSLRDVEQGVAIPYATTENILVADKLRTALAAKKGSRWTAGVPLTAYGLWALSSSLFAARNLFLVEGESDVWTAWYHQIPTLGIPGATTAKKTVTPEILARFDRIYVIQEPDSAGQKFVMQVADAIEATGWKGSAFVVNLPGAKDLNDLYKSAPMEFCPRLQQAVATAIPISEAVQTTVTIGSDWPEPESILIEDHEVPYFDAGSLLPSSIRGWVIDASERIGAPIEYAAVAGIVALGSAIGRKLVVRPNGGCQGSCRPG